VIDCRRGAASRSPCGFHDLELLEGQVPGSKQDVVGDPDLPDIVERSSAPEHEDVVLREAEHVGDHRGHRANSLRVLPGVIVAELGGHRQAVESLALSVLQFFRPLEHSLVEQILLAAESLIEESDFQDQLGPWGPRLRISTLEVVFSIHA
jgi:hypothetical protein